MPREPKLDPKFPTYKGENLQEICLECGHPCGEHDGRKCPPLPPAKQVVLDEAVAAKGGKPGSDFLKQLADASGATAAAEKAERAKEYFEAPAPELPAEVLPLGLHLVKPSPRNPRGSLGDVAELAKSIEKNGLLSPLLVRELTNGFQNLAEYEVVSGHRRLEAARQLGMDTVPCIVLEVGELRALELNLVEQIHRRDLTPLEEGEACRSLQELSGYSLEQVAGKLGQSVSWVRGRLALCGLAPEVRKQLAKGEVTLTLAKALAALPTQKMQVEALEEVEEEREYGDAKTDTEAVELLREKFCRPLKGAGWKLTDDTLVPEAGACSVCPKNSHNAKVVGLFDNVRAPPTCTDTPCYESKARALWEKTTAKYKAAGARILPPSEGGKLFQYDNGIWSLPYGSRYVVAKSPVQEDGAKRSWQELVEKLKPEQRPQLHVAQDKDGGVHLLFVKDKATEAIAEHLELKWAKKAASKEDPQASGPSAVDEWQKQRDARVMRQLIIDQVKLETAKRIATAGPTLPRLRALLVEDAEAYLEATKSNAKPEKWLKEASVNELLAAVWWCAARFDTYDGFDEDFQALAKAEGFDLKAMVKAQLAGAKVESEKAKQKADAEALFAKKGKAAS